jgi:hypothetical protein
MPIPGAVGDAYEVRVVGRIDGQVTNNVFHFKVATPIDDIELRIIVALATCFVDHLKPILSSSFQIENIVWKQVAPVLGVEHIYTGPDFGPCNGNAAALPSYASVVLSLRTLQGGKSHRGRKYIPGIPENATTNSTLDANGAFWAAIIAFAACVAGKFILTDSPPANAAQLMVYSRKLGGSKAPYGNAGFTAVTAINPVQVLGTTRSRKVGVGA